jgi:hypothetical protein
MSFLSLLRGTRKPQTDRRGVGQAVPARERHTTRPDLEVLEERTVPSVTFTPYFGAEGIGGSLTGGMQHPTVNVVFSGSYWTTSGTSGNGAQDQQTLTAAIQSILSGPYLSGLTQYGSDGKANFGQTWDDAATVPPSPSTGAVQGLLQNLLTSKNAAPGPYDWQHAPVEVVISDPASSSPPGSLAGWNRPGTYNWNWWPGLTMPENMNLIWVSTSNLNGIPAATNSHVNTDSFSLIFSHEIAEVMSDPAGQGVTVTPAANLPANVQGDHQICDYEPNAANYGYRLNSVLVQAYWSKNDQAYLVPDGNSQLFTLSTTRGTGWWTQSYDLHFSGDQLGANYNDNITLSAVGQSVRLNANGQAVQFDPGVINNVNIDTEGGSNIVQVPSLPSGVTANIGSIGLSSDAVYVGNGSLAGVQGTVNVSNSSGQTSLFVNDYLDKIGRAINVTDHSIDFSGTPTIGYTGGSYANGNGPLIGVTYLQVVDGQGSNLVSIQSVAPLTPLDFYACYYDLILNYPPGAHVYRTHY